MGEALNRTNANTVFTWLSAANNLANVSAYDKSVIQNIPSTNSGGELTSAIHHELKYLYRANNYHGIKISRFAF